MLEKQKRKTEQYRLDIPVTINRGEIVKQFNNERTRPVLEKHTDELIAMAQPVMRAKGLYRLACVGAHGDGWVEIDGVRFISRVLSKSLADIDSVILYIFTCGKELDELPVPPREYLRYYCLDLIKMHAALQAAGYFMKYLKEKFNLPDITHLHPGEFADLPIEQQVPLFSLFHDTESAIGVKLTSNKTIHPVKSGSGFLFHNGASFLSCQLCLQPHCAGRQAAYSPALAKKFGIMRPDRKNDR